MPVDEAATTPFTAPRKRPTIDLLKPVDSSSTVKPGDSTPQVFQTQLTQHTIQHQPPSTVPPSLSSTPSFEHAGHTPFFRGGVSKDDHQIQQIILSVSEYHRRVQSQLHQLMAKASLVEGLREQVAGLERDLMEAHGQVNQLRDEHLHYQRDLALLQEKTQSLTRSEARLLELVREVEEVEATNRQFKGQFMRERDRLAKELQDTRQEWDQLHRLKTQQAERLAQLEAEAEESVDRINSLQRSTANLKREADEREEALTGRCRRLEGSLKELREQKHALEEQLHEQESKQVKQAQETMSIACGVMECEEPLIANSMELAEYLGRLLSSWKQNRLAVEQTQAERTDELQEQLKQALSEIDQAKMAGRREAEVDLAAERLRMEPQLEELGRLREAQLQLSKERDAHLHELATLKQQISDLEVAAGVPLNEIPAKLQSLKADKPKEKAKVVSPDRLTKELLHEIEEGLGQMRQDSASQGRRNLVEKKPLEDPFVCVEERSKASRTPVASKPHRQKGRFSSKRSEASNLSDLNLWDFDPYQK